MPIAGRTQYSNLHEARNRIQWGSQTGILYYALQMLYQRVLAGSKNVDIVYGPEDEVPVIVVNLDESKTVDV